MPLVLLIDDDAAGRADCSSLLAGKGFRSLEAGSSSDGLRLFDSHRPALVLVSVQLPDGSGIEVLRRIQRKAPGTPVVVLSAEATIDEAVAAMQGGASDFLGKPIDRERLLRTIDRTLSPRVAVDAAPGGRAFDGARFGMIGRSTEMQRVYELIELAAPTRTRVFITGESGAGKELIARAIHDLSPRRKRPFVELNCAAIPSELIESEMFGHVRGAFTGAVVDRKGKFEAANTGSLFLDEVGDMSLAAQAKLLRALQEGVVTPVGSVEARPFDVRVISATSKHLPGEIAAGDFREDLYHRINVLTISVPPLRARGEDIAELAEHFLALACKENGSPGKTLSPQALDFLMQLPWPGNVRELRNLMEKLSILVNKPHVGYQDLMAVLRIERGRGESTGALPLRQARARFEKGYILERLAANQGKLGQTAQDLGIDRSVLYRKMKQLGIETRGTLQD
jgi:two-component system nitrogen regulation response regulator NtrX